MKILLLTNAMDMGGAETHVLTLARALCARGHGVVVGSAGGRMVDALRACGVRHVCLPLNSLRPDRLLVAYRRLSRLLAHESFEVVHAHARIPAFLVSLLTKKRGICLVTTAHADFSTAWPRTHLSRWGSATVAVSEDLEQRLCEQYGLDSSQITVIRNGIDLSHFSPAANPKEEGTLHIVCMSRLDEDCAAAARLLCRIAPRLHREIEGLVITIVGGGGAYAEIAQRAAEVRRTSGVTLVVTGRVDDPRPLLCSCDVFVGVSRAALEAMACGCCVILGGDEGFFGHVTEENVFVAARENFCARGYVKMDEERLMRAIREVCAMGAAARCTEGNALRDYVAREQSVQGMVDATEKVYAQAKQRLCTAGNEVLLCGYYGYGNLGDDALLRASVRRAQETFPGCGIVALTHGGSRDAWKFGISCIRRNRPLAVMRAIRHAKVVVFGGGTLLQDVTSRRSLRYYTFLLRYAKRRGVPCELWANGIGMLTRRGSERCVFRALMACRYVSLRDERSFHIAERMMRTSPSKPVREEDLAIKTPSSSPSRVSYLWDRFGRPKNKGAIGVALKGGAPRGVLRAMKRWLCGLCAEGYTLYFVSMYPREDDALTDALCKELGGVRLRGVGAGDLVGLFGGCEAVCSMRLHALVFAAVAGTPFVGFGTDEKIEGFCREHGGVYYLDLYGRKTTPPKG